MSAGLHARLRAPMGEGRLDVELSVAGGQTAVLLGPNGAGKSTLVRALAGLVDIDEGRIVLDGREVTHAPPQERHVAVQFQSNLLLPWLSVLENVAYGRRSRGEPASDARESARRWLERLDVADLAGRSPKTLSGGQARRVSLARALAAGGDLLILDEPTTSLDIDARVDARRVIAEVIREVAAPRLIVTHDPVEALSFADELYIMEAGRVVQSGDPASIRARPRSEYAASLVGVNLIKGHLGRQGDRWKVDTPGEPLWVADVDLPPGTAVLARIHPRSIILSSEPLRTSARNVLAGRIASIAIDQDRARILLATTPGLTVEVTTNAIASLGLEQGLEVWASFKATDIEVYPR